MSDVDAPTSGGDDDDDDVSDVFAVWENTRKARVRLLTSPAYGSGGGPNGSYKGYPIIGRDSRIAGGVSVGQVAREAIVVEENDVLEDIYFALERRLQERQVKRAFRVMQEVYDLVQERMPTSEKAVDKVMAMWKVKPDELVALTQFAGWGGVCRHQALLAGYLIERLIDEEVITGRVSMDRNHIPTLGRHTWVRYTKADGTVIIVDPTQKYIGPETDARTKRRHRWNYRRLARTASAPVMIRQNIHNPPVPPAPAPVVVQSVPNPPTGPLEREWYIPEPVSPTNRWRALSVVGLIAIFTATGTVIGGLALAFMVREAFEPDAITGTTPPPTIIHPVEPSPVIAVLAPPPPEATSVETPDVKQLDPVETPMPKAEPVTCGWYYDSTYGPQAVMLDGKYLLECSDGKVYRAGISSCARGACTHDNLTEVSRDNLKR